MDKYTFDYTWDQIANPAGRNDLTSQAKFFQRSLYRETAYPYQGMSPHPHNIPKPIDLWYDKNLYGRVDRCQNTISAVTSNLKVVRHAVSPQIYCLDFVEVAFDAFVKHMRDAYLMNCLSREGNEEIWNPKAILGYTSPDQKWNTYVDGLIDAFISAHVDLPGRVIKGYDDFFPLFKNYILEVAKTYPITKENFFLTNMVSPFISGLSLSISRLPAGDDKAKYEEYLLDPNFDFYVKAAKKFGFIVNKNMPWMLTADLFTDAIKRWMRHFEVKDASGTVYQITEDNLFETYYNKPHHTAFDALRYLFARGYTRLLDQRPLYSEQKILFQKKCLNKFVEINRSRQKLTMRQISAAFKDKFLIDFYITLRHIESQKSYPSLKNIKFRAYEIYRLPIQPSLSRVRNVVDYINEVYRIYPYPANFGNISFQIGLDKFMIKDIIDTGIEVGAEPRCNGSARPGTSIAIAAVGWDKPDIPPRVVTETTPVPSSPGRGDSEFPTRPAPDPTRSSRTPPREHETVKKTGGAVDPSRTSPEQVIDIIILERKTEEKVVTEKKTVDQTTVAKKTADETTASTTFSNALAAEFDRVAAASKTGNTERTTSSKSSTYG